MKNTTTGTVKVNFNFPILGLHGKPLMMDEKQELTAAKLLASIIANMNKGDIYKLMEWAKKCYNGHDIEMNVAERKTFEEIVVNSEEITILAKEQILNALN